MSEYFDIPHEANKYFPSHGWTVNLQGARILSLPVICLYQHGQKHHKYFIDNNIGGVWLQSRSPNRTLRHLAVCFRDLHKEFRESLPLMELWSGEKGDKEIDLGLTRLIEGRERSEVLLIAAFTLLRRLADELINASRPFLFEHWQSAPQEMKKAIPAASEGKLIHLKPICNLEVLTDALLNHTGWFDKLRANEGIRDILVHRPHIFHVSAQGTQKKEDEDINWSVTAHLTRNIGKENKLKSIDILRSLIECIDEACQFMKLFCISAGLDDGYQKERFQQGGFMMLTGQDNDIVGFWPPIDGSRSEFPILD